MAFSQPQPAKRSILTGFVEKKTMYSIYEKTKKNLYKIKDSFKLKKFKT